MTFNEVKALSFNRLTQKNKFMNRNTWTKTIGMLAILLSINSLHAQRLPLHFGIGVDVGLPTGDQADVYAITAGLSANAAFSLLSKLDLIGSLGYQRWMGKRMDEYDVNNDFELVQAKGDRVPDASYIPLLVGAKYNIGLPNLPLFAKLEAGPVFNTKSEPAVNSVGIGVSPGFGVSIGKLDALLKYEGWRNNGYTATFVAAKLIYRIF